MISSTEQTDSFDSGIRQQESQTDFVVETFSINIFDQKGNNISNNESRELKVGHWNDASKPNKKKAFNMSMRDKENIPSKTKSNFRELDLISKRVSIKIETSRSDVSPPRSQASDRAVEKATQTDG